MKLASYFVNETWLSAHAIEAKTVELAPSGLNVKVFTRQSRSRVGGIATIYYSILESSITFEANFDFTHFDQRDPGINRHPHSNTLHFFCLYRPPPNRRNNLTDSMFTEKLPDFLNINNFPGLVCLVGYMNIQFKSSTTITN